MANTPRDSRNRKGCFLTFGVVALFIVMYLLVGLNAKPGNNISSKIQTLPGARR